MSLPVSSTWASSASILSLSVTASVLSVFSESFQSWSSAGFLSLSGQAIMLGEPFQQIFSSKELSFSASTRMLGESCERDHSAIDFCEFTVNELRVSSLTAWRTK